MAINQESRRKQFKDCTSFEELAKVCNRYGYVFENFADEVRNKLYELPAEFNEDFIKFLLKSYHLDNDLTEDNLRTTYASFLRDYANKIVNAGILKNPGIKSEYIPVIVFSTTNHDQIDMSYLLETCSINPKSIEEIFYNKNYDNIMSTKLESNQDIKYSRDEMRIIDILTSNAAYEDFLYQFSTELDKKEGTEYLYLRAQKIFNQYIAPHAIIDTKEIEVMDIYNFL